MVRLIDKITCVKISFNDRFILAIQIRMVNQYTGCPFK